MSIKVVFIILSSAIKSRIVCDLAEKCYQDGKRLIIYSEKAEGGKNLDQLLWTWKQQSFIPHQYVDILSERKAEPVVLTTEIAFTDGYDSIILFDPLPVGQLQSFDLIIDFAEKYDMPALTASRERYKTYRSNNFQIESLPPGEFLHS